MMDDLVICIENCYILSDGKCFIKKNTLIFAKSWNFNWSIQVNILKHLIDAFVNFTFQQ